MLTEEFVLRPTDRPAITLRGRVVAHAIGPTDDPKLLGRSHEITVYEIESGDLHLVFEFKTEHADEVPRCDLELNVQSDEIADVLLMYDPTEYLNRQRLRHRHESVIKTFLKQLHREYDDLCASIEQQMLDYEPPLPLGGSENAVEPSQSIRSGWRSWMPFGKPR